MAKVYFDSAAFRAQFPTLFCGANALSDATLQVYFDTATIYINNQSGGCYCGGLTLVQLRQALYLMMAHLIAISQNISSGQSTGVVTSASIDKVSVTIAAPPAGNNWQYWLQSTPYGQQILALLSKIAVGGTYIGGCPELLAFRRP